MLTCLGSLNNKLGVYFLSMKAWKAIGYIFVGVGTVFVFYAFFVGVQNTINSINPLTAMDIDSTGSYMDSFFSSLLSAIAPWMIIASVLFVLGGIGLFVGRNKHPVKSPSEQEAINARIDRLEKLVDRNFEVISKRLDDQEQQQKNP
jgi:hypothetical protein